jgi:hypothetical protein
VCGLNWNPSSVVWDAADLESSGLQPVMEVLNQAVKAVWMEKAISEPLDASLGPVVCP